MRLPVPLVKRPECWVLINRFLAIVSNSVLLYVHRDRKDSKGRGAQDVHLDFHTALEL